MSGKVPELWNAETGETGIPVEYEEKDGMTCLNLRLPESGSVFVVFRKGNRKASPIKKVVPVSTTVHTRTGDRSYADTDTFRSTFSVSLWAKPETFAAAGRGFLLFPSAEKGNRAWVGISMGQNGIRVYERNRRNEEVLAYMHPVEGWTHVLLVYREGVPVLYVNGRKVASGKRSAFDCVPAIDIPMEEEQYIASFEGDQTATEVFGYALTEREVSEQFSLGLPLPRMEETVWKDLSKDWKVNFPESSKAPSEIHLSELVSLHKHADFNVRHFSGTATYVKRFMLTQADMDALQSKQVTLNLGRVENIAEISLNGAPFTLVWKAPYSVDITGALSVGENLLKIKVTNLYPNRMIGDEHLPELYEYDEYGRLRRFPDWYLKGEYNERERVLFLPWKYYKKTDPLLESGLVGPVRIGIVNK